MILKTPGTSYLLMRRAGFAEWFITPALRQAFLAHTNTYFLRAERMDLRLLGGRHQWTHDRPTGQATLTCQYSPIAGLPQAEALGLALEQPHYLEETRGYHEDGALYQLAYDDPMVSVAASTAGDPGRKAILKVGSMGGLDTGRRVEWDIDDETYTQSIGQTEDGSVRRTRMTARNTRRRTWHYVQTIGNVEGRLHHEKIDSGDQDRIEREVFDDGVVKTRINKDNSEWDYQQTIGSEGDRLHHEKIATGDQDRIEREVFDDGVVKTRINRDNSDWDYQQTIGDDASRVLHEKVTAGDESRMEFTLRGDGSIELDLNDGQTVITVDEEGDVTLTTDGYVHVVSNEIRLGSGDAAEPLVLGTAWKTLYNTFITLFNAHTHISNMGAPTGIPIQQAASMTDTQLSNVSFTERQSG